jgi:hypothetical protein
VNQGGKWLFLIAFAVSFPARRAFAEALPATPAKPAYFTPFLEKTILKVPTKRSVEARNDRLSDIVVTLRGSFGGLEGRVLLNIVQRLRN